MRANSRVYKSPHVLHTVKIRLIIAQRPSIGQRPMASPRHQAILGTRPCRRGRLAAHRTGTTAPLWRHPQSWPTWKVDQNGQEHWPGSWQKKMTSSKCALQSVLWLKLIYVDIPLLFYCILKWQSWCCLDADVTLTRLGLSWFIMCINSLVLAKTLGFTQEVDLSTNRCSYQEQSLMQYVVILSSTIFVIYMLDFTLNIISI